MVLLLHKQHAILKKHIQYSRNVHWCLRHDLKSFHCGTKMYECHHKTMQPYHRQCCALTRNGKYFNLRSLFFLWFVAIVVVTPFITVRRVTLTVAMVTLFWLLQHLWWLKFEEIKDGTSNIRQSSPYIFHTQTLACK